MSDSVSNSLRVIKTVKQTATADMRHAPRFPASSSAIDPHIAPYSHGCDLPLCSAPRAHRTFLNLASP